MRLARGRQGVYAEHICTNYVGVNLAVTRTVWDLPPALVYRNNNNNLPWSFIVQQQKLLYSATVDRVWSGRVPHQCLRRSSAAAACNRPLGAAVCARPLKYSTVNDVCLPQCHYI